MAQENKRRRFTNEYKKNAVKMVTEKGLPVEKVARDLDIHPQLLHAWRKKYFHKGNEAFGNPKPEEVELKKLRKKLAEVEEERDILKKALAVFSRQNG
jgi:transposase